MPLDAIKDERRAVVKDAEHGPPFRSGRIVVACCNPRRANSNSTAPTERFRSPAIDFAVSRISSPMFNVVLMPEKLLQ